MSVAIESRFTDELASFDQYRALSVSAVASVVLAALSLTAFLSSIFWTIPILGVLIGLVAIYRIDSNPQELTGRKLAIVGIAGSALLGGLGAAWNTYAYFAEVPEGYERITYAQLQPPKGAVISPAAPEIPAAARSLDGKKVFIKGFMYPGAQTVDIKEFVLCRDKGTCCFGGATPKLTDMIQIELKPPLVTSHSAGIRGFAGVFRVAPGKASDNLGGVLYRLEADYVK